ncbi:ATP-binding cassette domain-containing protein [Mycolicibacterium aubagnense]
MRGLAGEGRTVLVSSHLLAEMANTADRLVVIGRGRLIASTTMAEFVARAGRGVVRARSPQLERLREVLTAQGVSVQREGEGLTVTDCPSERVGELAAAHGITLHELSARQVSLEDAYLRLTDGAVDYRSVS